MGEMESLCLQVVNRVKDAFDLPGQVESSPERGAWIGSDLSQWGRTQNAATEERVDDFDRNDSPEEAAQGTEGQLDFAKDSGTANSLPVTSSADRPILLYQVNATCFCHHSGSDFFVLSPLPSSHFSPPF